MTQYSIAQARDQFAQLVHKVESGETAELTRRGQRVAVIVSAEEYDRFQPKKDFWKSVLAFRAEYQLDNRQESKIDLSDEAVDEIFSSVREQSSGREVETW